MVNPNSPDELCSVADRVFVCKEDKKAFLVITGEEIYKLSDSGTIVNVHVENGSFVNETQRGKLIEYDTERIDFYEKNYRELDNVTSISDIAPYLM